MAAESYLPIQEVKREVIYTGCHWFNPPAPADGHGTTFYHFQIDMEGYTGLMIFYQAAGYLNTSGGRGQSLNSTTPDYFETSPSMWLSEEGPSEYSGYGSLDNRADPPFNLRGTDPASNGDLVVFAVATDKVWLNLGLKNSAWTGASDINGNPVYGPVYNEMSPVVALKFKHTRVPKLLDNRTYTPGPISPSGVWLSESIPMPAGGLSASVSLTIEPGSIFSQPVFDEGISYEYDGLDVFMVLESNGMNFPAGIAQAGSMSVDHNGPFITDVSDCLQGTDDRGVIESAVHTALPGVITLNDVLHYKKWLPTDANEAWDYFKDKPYGLTTSYLVKLYGGGIPITISKQRISLEPFIVPTGSFKLLLVPRGAHDFRDDFSTGNTPTYTHVVNKNAVTVSEVRVRVSGEVYAYAETIAPATRISGVARRPSRWNSGSSGNNMIGRPLPASPTGVY